MFSNLDDALRGLLKSVILEVLDALPALKRSESTNKPTEPMLITSKEAAKLLAMSDRNLSRLEKAGRIPCVRIDSLVRYDVQALRQWIKQPIPEATSQEVVTAPQQETPEPRRISKPVAPIKAAKKKPPRVADARPASDRWTERPSKAEEPTGNKPRLVREFFAQRLGIKPDTIPEMTFGEVRRIAEVDIPTLHGWIYLGKELPEAAMTKLDVYFRSRGEVS